jgi:hypothetical protein
LQAINANEASQANKMNRMRLFDFASMAKPPPERLISYIESADSHKCTLLLLATGALAKSIAISDHFGLIERL